MTPEQSDGAPQGPEQPSGWSDQSGFLGQSAELVPADIANMTLAHLTIHGWSACELSPVGLYVLTDFGCIAYFCQAQIISRLKIQP